MTEAVLLAQGFGDGARDFEALLAVDGDAVLGMAVHYMVPFTYRARPTLYLKELYVAEAGRNRGAGAALMAALARRARDRGCGLVKGEGGSISTISRAASRPCCRASAAKFDRPRRRRWP